MAINAGSELILRQLFDRFGQQVHLLTPRITTALSEDNRRFAGALRTLLT